MEEMENKDCVLKQQMSKNFVVIYIMNKVIQINQKTDLYHKSKKIFNKRNNNKKEGSFQLINGNNSH